jgi:hypothetical protein
MSIEVVSLLSQVVIGFTSSVFQMLLHLFSALKNDLGAKHGAVKTAVK